MNNRTGGEDGVHGLQSVQMQITTERNKQLPQVPMERETKKDKQKAGKENTGDSATRMADTNRTNEQTNKTVVVPANSGEGGNVVRKDAPKSMYNVCMCREERKQGRKRKSEAERQSRG